MTTYTNQTNTITLTEIKKKAVGTQLIDRYCFIRDDGKKIEMPAAEWKSKEVKEWKILIPLHP